MDLEQIYATRIAHLMEQMDKKDVTSDERKAMLQEVVDLGRLGEGLAKINAEHEDRIKSQEIDRNLRISQLKEDRRERIFKYTFEGAKFVGSLIATACFTHLAYRNERDGTVPMTQVGREHVKHGFRIRGLF